MKKFKALEYSPGAEIPRVRSLDFQLSTELQALRQALSEPTVLVFPDSFAEQLLEFSKVIVDRRTKHPAKSLATLLLGYEKIPLIRGGYKNTGQLIRSIKTLLLRAAAGAEHNLYLIAIPGNLFESLWLLRKSKTGTPGGNAGRKSIPTELRQRYLGTSSYIEKIHKMIMLAAGNSEPVLILGETGTGKEIIAQSIHRYSRPDKPFQAINCGAIPAELLELTLFGYMKGSHHLAVVDTKGVWETAGEGTLFLDEIGDLALNHQVKILRALQEGRIRRIGSNQEIEVKARVIAATNKNLSREVRLNNFRKDLLSRLDVIRIETPPLRKHPQDILLIAQVRWREITEKTRPPLTDHLLTALSKYHWPGNVRELENVIKKLHYLNPGNRSVNIDNLNDILTNSDLKYRLEQLTQSQGNAFDIELWVEPSTRDFAPDTKLFNVGDPVQLCVRPDRECQLFLFDLGTTGDITFIPPNPGLNNRVQAGEEIRIPGILKGTAGSETLFAFASSSDLDIDPGRWYSSEEGLCDILDMLEKYNAEIQDNTIAVKSLSFEIAER